MSRQSFDFIGDAIDWSIDQLKHRGTEVDTGHWQGVPTGGKPDLMTKEILDLTWSARIPDFSELEVAIDPSWPWAENHFKERVSRVPSNPGEEYKNWPWWHGQQAVTAADPLNTDTVMVENKPGGKVGGGFKFSHTYQERFWPKKANREYADPWRPGYDARGIRYPYGDLDDVVDLLVREPHTRQAYFPIFFPEDTGAVHGGRIPCSLGYHFLLRGGQLHCWYDIRSCDAVRHFRDDLYLACRLTEWVLRELHVEESETLDGDYPWSSASLGRLYFTAHSFHVHMGDYHLL